MLDKWKTVAALKENNGALAQADTLLATAIRAAGDTTKNLGTEIKVAAAGAAIAGFSPEIAATLNLFGLSVDETQIDTIGNALILGAGVSGANKLIDNFSNKYNEDVKETAEETKKKKKNKQEAIEVITEE